MAVRCGVLPKGTLRLNPTGWDWLGLAGNAFEESTDTAKLGGTIGVLRAGRTVAGVPSRDRCAYWKTWSGEAWDYV